MDLSEPLSKASAAANCAFAAAPTKRDWFACSNCWLYRSTSGCCPEELSKLSEIETVFDIAYGTVNVRSFQPSLFWLSSSSGNLFLEYEIEHYPEGKLSKRDKGWFSKCKAEYLFYYDIRKDILRVYELNDLKEYINNHYVSTI